MGKEDLSPDEQEYNFPPPPKGGMNLWVGDQGQVPDGLLGLAERFHQEVPLGKDAPALKGNLLDGSTLDLADYRGGKMVCVIFGSLSDPPLISNLNTARPSVNDLYSTYYPQGVEFVFVYTREAHPGPLLPPHDSLDLKIERAKALREQESLLMPMVIDSMDGATHKAWGTFTNPVYMVNRWGVVIAKSAFLDTSVLSGVLSDAVAWDNIDDGNTVVKKGYHERIHMCRAPYDPACRDKERQALEDSGGPEMIEKIRQMAGFDPLTWHRTK